MQFFWFRSSAIAELDAEHHSIVSTVTQTVSREYQRYAPLISSLRELAADGTASPAETETALSRLYGLYGPKGSVPGLVASVGIASPDTQTETTKLGTDGIWKRGKSEFSPPGNGIAMEKLAAGSLVFCDGLDASERQFLLVRAGPASIAVLEIDMERFFDTYIKPAIASVFPGAAIEWADAVAPARPSEGTANVRGDKTRTTFNPLLALLRVGAKERRTFLVSVPLATSHDVMHSIGSLENETSGDYSASSHSPPQSAEGHASRSAFKTKSATIVMPEGSAISTMELRLSLNWLLSVFFLVGIGLAFAQTILQKQKLRSVSEQEREFVASVTHELRTPVTAIRTAADNMRKGLIGQERVVAYGEMIHSQSIRLGSMIEEMLLFSQVERRKVQPPAFREIRPRGLLDALRAPLDEIAQSSGIALKWDFGALPEQFCGDADSIQVIVCNLVANALYHAYGQEKGEVRVTGRISVPATLQVLVEDDGRGIAKAEAKLVFEPFYRDEECRSRHEKGSGLGLFIAKRKAELLGGRLSLESPYKRMDGSKRPGCRFKLELPIEEPDDAH